MKKKKLATVAGISRVTRPSRSVNKRRKCQLRNTEQVTWPNIPPTRINYKSGGSTTQCHFYDTKLTPNCRVGNVSLPRDTIPTLPFRLLIINYFFFLQWILRWDWQCCTTLPSLLIKSTAMSQLSSPTRRRSIMSPAWRHNDAHSIVIFSRHFNQKKN